MEENRQRIGKYADQQVRQGQVENQAVERAAEVFVGIDANGQEYEEVADGCHCSQDHG